MRAMPHNSQNLFLIRSSGTVKTSGCERRLASVNYKIQIPFHGDNMQALGSSVLQFAVECETGAFSRLQIVALLIDRLIAYPEPTNFHTVLYFT